MENNSSVESLVDDVIKKIAAIEHEGEGGYILASCVSNEDIDHFGEILSNRLMKPPDPSIPPFAPVPYDLFEYETEDPKEVGEPEKASEKAKEKEAKAGAPVVENYTPEERYLQIVKSLTSVEVMLVYGAERNKDEGFRILDATSYVPANDKKLVVMICLASMVDEMPERSKDFWSWAKENIVLVPRLGLIPSIIERYRYIAGHLRKDSQLNTYLNNLLRGLDVFNQNLEKIKKIMVGNPRLTKILSQVNKFPSLVSLIDKKIDEFHYTIEPLETLHNERVTSLEGTKTIDRLVKKGLSLLAEINDPLNKSLNILNNLMPVFKALNKNQPADSTGVNPIEKLQILFRNFSIENLYLVVKAVEIGSISSSKTLITRALTSLSSTKWDWNAIARQLSTDVILVSKLIGAANIKIRDESIGSQEKENKYAFVNAIKVLGEDNLRLFLTWQANAVRMELSPGFRPVFDGIFLHTVYTIKVIQKLIEVIKQANTVIEIDEQMARITSQMHNVGVVFFCEFVATFLATNANVPAKERHSYLNIVSRAYPRRDNIFENFATSLEMIQFEYNTFGYDHTRMGKEIAHKLEWPEDDPIIWVISNHHHPAFVYYTPEEEESMLPDETSPMDQIPKKDQSVAIVSLYLLILANQIFEKYARYKELRKVAQELKIFQDNLETSTKIDKRYRMLTKPLREVLARQTVMEEMVTYLAHLVENYRQILPNAKDDFTMVAFGK